MAEEENNLNKQEQNEEEEGESRPLSAIEKAENLNNSLKEQNDRMEANLERLENLKATEMLGGSSQAGQTPLVAKEETPAEYKDRVMRGDLN